jgi:hypothetical protein
VDRNGTEGDFKRYASARAVQDPETRGAYRATVRARIDREPTDPFHLFRVDIESAGFVIFSPKRYAMAWDPQGRTRRWEQRLE